MALGVFRPKDHRRWNVGQGESVQRKRKKSIGSFAVLEKVKMIGQLEPGLELLLLVALVLPATPLGNSSRQPSRQSNILKNQPGRNILSIVPAKGENERNPNMLLRCYLEWITRATKAHQSLDSGKFRRSVRAKNQAGRAFNLEPHPGEHQRLQELL